MLKQNKEAHIIAAQYSESSTSGGLGGHHNLHKFDPNTKLNELIDEHRGDFPTIDSELRYQEETTTEVLQNLVFTHSPQLLNIFTAIKASLDEVQQLKRTVSQTKSVIGEISSTSCTTAVLSEAIESSALYRQQGGSGSDGFGGALGRSLLHQSPFHGRGGAFSAGTGTSTKNTKDNHIAAIRCRSRLVTCCSAATASTGNDGNYGGDAASFVSAAAPQLTRDHLCQSRSLLKRSVEAQRSRAKAIVASASHKSMAEASEHLAAKKEVQGFRDQKRASRLAILYRVERELQSGNFHDAMELVGSVASGPDAEELDFLPELLQVEHLLMRSLKHLTSFGLPPTLRPVVGPSLMRMILELGRVSTGKQYSSDATAIVSSLHLQTQTEVINRSLMQLGTTSDRDNFPLDATRLMVDIIISAIDEQEALVFGKKADKKKSLEAQADITEGSMSNSVRNKSFPSTSPLLGEEAKKSFGFMYAGALSSLAQWISDRIESLEQSVVSPHLKSISTSGIHIAKRSSGEVSSSSLKMKEHTRGEEVFVLRLAEQFPEATCGPLAGVSETALASCRALLPLEDRGFPNSAVKLCDGIVQRVLIPAINRCVGSIQEVCSHWSDRSVHAPALRCVLEALYTGRVPVKAFTNVQRVVNTNPKARSLISGGSGLTLVKDFNDALRLQYEPVKNAMGVLADTIEGLTAESEVSVNLKRLMCLLYPSYHHHFLPSPADVEKRVGSNIFVTTCAFAGVATTSNEPPKLSASIDPRKLRTVLQLSQRHAANLSPFTAKMISSITGMCVVVSHLGRDGRRSTTLSAAADAMDSDELHKLATLATVSRMFGEHATLSEAFDTAITQGFKSWLFALDEFSTQIMPKLRKVVGATSNLDLSASTSGATILDVLTDKRPQAQQYRHFYLAVSNALLQDLLCARELLEVVERVCKEWLPDSVHLDFIHKKVSEFVTNITRQTTLSVDDHKADDSDSSSDDEESSSDEDEDYDEFKFVERLINARYMSPHVPSPAGGKENILNQHFLFSTRITKYPAFRFDAFDPLDEGALFHFAAQISLNLVFYLQHMTSTFPSLGDGESGAGTKTSASSSSLASMVASAAFGGGNCLCTNTPTYIMEGLKSTAAVEEQPLGLAAPYSVPKASLSVSLHLIREVVLVMFENYFCTDEYWATALNLAPHSPAKKPKGRQQQQANSDDEDDEPTISAMGWKQIVVFFSVMHGIWKPMFRADTPTPGNEGGDRLQTLITEFLGTRSPSQPEKQPRALSAQLNDPSTLRKVTKLLQVDLCTFSKYYDIEQMLNDDDDEDEEEEESEAKNSVCLLDIHALLHLMCM